jgi:roadblock/LC7 domain-containing protein
MRRCAAEDGYMNANSDKDYIDAKVETMHTLLDERLGAFQAMMDGRFAEFGAMMDGRFAEFQAMMDGRFAEFQAKMDGRFAEMRAYMDGRFAELKSELKAQMADNTAQLIKWMVGVWIGGLVVFITVITFVLNNAVPKAQPIAPVAQAPIIIQLPPQVWTQQGPPPAAPQQQP